MSTNTDKLIRLNGLVSKHFHKKHIIVMPPKMDSSGSLETEEIEYDNGSWKLEDIMQEYVESLLKQNDLSDEMKILMVYEKLCKTYVYDDNLISYIERIDNDVFDLPPWYGRVVDENWEENRKSHNRRICFELSRYLATAIKQLTDGKDDLNVCILWNRDLTHYFVGLTCDEYSVTLDTDDFFYIKDLTRIKAGLTAKGVRILEDTSGKFTEALAKFNEGKNEHSIEDIEAKRDGSYENAIEEEDEDVLYLKIIMDILIKKYNLDSQGIFEYMKEIIDIKFGSEIRRKIWKRIEGNSRESIRHIRCLVVNIKGKDYLIDGDQGIIRYFSKEDQENARGSYIPYSALSRGYYDYYNGK